MTPEDLELRTTQGVTALHFAAQSGIVRINAEQLVKINNKPLLIHDSYGRKPLHYAVELGHRNMVSYLIFCVTPFEQLTVDERTKLLLNSYYLL
jgi:ankyrin repeat protein